jgi:hypothetical protein
MSGKLKPMSERKRRFTNRASRMVLFAGFVMQRDWIIERNKESNRLYRAIAPDYPSTYRYCEKFIV